ncbi:MAG: glycosyltransferase [Planctomycetota bacterium]
MNIKPRTLLSAPDNRPWAIGRYLKTALEQLDVPVCLFDFREADDLGADLLERIVAFKPDLHILFKGERFNKELLDRVREAGVPTVLWHHDVDPDLPPWLLEVAGASDYFFTHARGMVDKFRKAGIPQTDWLSEGFPETFFAFDTITEDERYEFSCHATLVGNIHMNERYRLRAKMIDRVLAEGLRAKWWGPRISRKLKNWPLILSRAGRAYGGRMLANADFAKAVNCADIFLARDVHPEVDGSVSNRLYWACGSGAFYLTHYSEGIEEIMVPGKEIETFTTLDEMAEKIRFYLDHPKARQQIARAGQKRVLKQYTFRHRFEEMFHRLREVGLV